MVITSAAVCFDLHQPKVGIKEQGTTSSKTYSVRCKLIRVALPSQISSVTSAVGDTQCRTESEVPFDREIPFVDLWVFVVNVTRLLEELSPQLCKLRRKRIRKLQRRFAVDDTLVIERLVR